MTTALLEATARLAAQSDALALVQSMCEGLVAATLTSGLAWAWFGHPDTHEIRPMVAVGPANGLCRRARHRAQPADVDGSRLLARSAGRNRITRPSSRFSLYGPWRAASKSYGFEVAAAFPPHIRTRASSGILVFYADNADSLRSRRPTSRIRRLRATRGGDARAGGASRATASQKSTHDALTGLHNRAWLTDELEEMHANALRYGASLRAG